MVIGPLIKALTLALLGIIQVFLILILILLAGCVSVCFHPCLKM